MESVALPAARGQRTCRVDGHLPFIDVDDLAIRIDDEGRAARHALRPEHAVGFSGFSLEVAQQRLIDVKDFLGPILLARQIVRGDAEYFRACRGELLEVRAECLHFLSAATGEGSREKGEDYGVLPFEIRQG